MSLTKFTITILIQCCFLKFVIPKKPLFITRIIHHTSVQSPYYNQNMTIRETVEQDLEITRDHYMKKSSSFRPTSFNTIGGTKKTGFTASVQVGEEKLKQDLYVDTGSSLLWINCDPHSLFVPIPIYDPSKSSSYRAESCWNSPFCYGLGAVRTWCGPEGYKCNYDQRFLNNKINSGHLAVETFFFETSKTSAENIVFGCSSNTNLFANGVLGLGPNKVSLPSQVNYQIFAYCIGNLSDIWNSLSTLSIGNLVISDDNITPLIIDDKYYINLVSIEFGSIKLEIDPEIFKRNIDNYTGGMLIDSASTSSYLPRVALNKFEEAMGNLLDPIFQQRASVEWKGNLFTSDRLCYHGNLNYDLNVSPDVKFNFENGGHMYLKVDNLFQHVDFDTFCLAFLPSEGLGAQFSIMGALMQQYFEVTFDLSRKIVSFWTNEDCSIDPDEY